MNGYECVRLKRPEHYHLHWVHQTASTRFQGKNYIAIASVVISVLPRAKIFRDFSKEKVKTGQKQNRLNHLVLRWKRRHEGYENLSFKAVTILLKSFTNFNISAVSRI